MYKRQSIFRHFSVLCLLVFVFFSIEIHSNQITRISNIEIKKELAILRGYSFLNLNLPTYYQCAVLCYSFIICDSLIFHSKKRLCLLNLISIGEGLLYLYPKNAIAIDRVHIPKALSGACMNHECDQRSQCIDNSGHASCIPMFKGSECDSPLPFPFVYAATPLPVLPGEVANIVCIPPLFGRLQIVCSADGKWNVPQSGHSCLPDLCDAVSITKPNYKSGVILTRTLSRQNHFVHRSVYCDAGTDGGNWLVIQRRRNTTLDFTMNKARSNEGFGDLQADFWIGITDLFALTSYAEMELRVEFSVTGNKTVHYAKYDTFFVGGKNATLFVGNFSGGNSGDGLSYLNGLSFEVDAGGSGGWWKDGKCDGTNLNAAEGTKFFKWSNGCGDKTASSVTNISSTQMMIRRKRLK